MRFNEGSNKEDREKKKEEFYRLVDSGAFDDVILARKKHDDEQSQERRRRRENPTTPDELIDSVELSDEETQRQIDEFEKYSKENPLSEEDQKYLDESTERDWNSWGRALEKGDTMPLLRQLFKNRNLEAYLAGNLNPR